MDVRLKTEAEIGACVDRQIFGAQRRLGFAIEGFDFGPLELDDVESQGLLLPCPTWIFLQPGFELGTEITKGKRARRASGDVSLGHGLEARGTEDSSQTGKIFDHAGEEAKPVLTIVNFEAF